jgi:hypothetical protein
MQKRKLIEPLHSHRQNESVVASAITTSLCMASELSTKNRETLKRDVTYILGQKESCSTW